MPQLVLRGLDVPKVEVRNVFFGLLPPPSVRDAIYAAGEAIRRYSVRGERDFRILEKWLLRDS